MEPATREITIDDIRGMKQLRRVAKLLGSLHDGGCGRDRAGNRELPYAFPYQYRWTIEIFFRFFKQTLGCRHLLSTRTQGVQIQIYASVMCCMLLNNLTGRKPTKWMVLLISLHLQGLASDEDVLRELTKKDNTGIKLRAEAERMKQFGIT